MGIGDDWPFSYWDLAPFYDLNDKTVGIAGVPGNPAYPRRNVELLPLPGFTPGTNKLREACDRLGWFWWPSDQAIITVPYNGRNPKNFRERKNRADVVHWPEAIKNGVVLKTRATVREITVNSKGLADGALYFDAEGKLHEQKARVVVVACNGIGTPRLLLNSKSKHFPHGLANGSGLVGKGLMSHPKATTTAEFDDGDASLSTIGGTFRVHEFYDPQPGRDFIGGCQLTTGNFTNPIAIALGIQPESRVSTIPASLDSGSRRTGRAIPWGKTHHAAFDGRYRRSATVSIHTSELSEEANRVELHATLTDDFGTPAPKLIYQRSENTKKVLEFALDRAKELLMESGAARITVAEWETKTSGRGAAPGHYLGTARMGSNPERSVVNMWGRAHDVQNLFIIDGSVFVTSGATEPTSTIQANALRIAEYFKNNSRKLLT
jgi:choline dehydrogenase-like flavoprotein